MAAPPTTRSRLEARSRVLESLPVGVRFEAPLSQSPYPVAAPVDTCWDTRDLDLDDGLLPYQLPRRD